MGVFKGLRKAGAGARQGERSERTFARRSTEVGGDRRELAAQRVDVEVLGEGNEQAVAWAFDVPGDVSASADVVGQEDVTAVQLQFGAVAHFDLDGPAEVHDELPPRRIVEVQFSAGWRGAKHHAFGLEQLREAAVATLGHCNVNGLEMGFAVVAGVDACDLH